MPPKWVPFHHANPLGLPTADWGPAVRMAQTRSWRHGRCDRRAAPKCDVGRVEGLPRVVLGCRLFVGNGARWSVLHGGNVSMNLFSFLFIGISSDSMILWKYLGQEREIFFSTSKNRQSQHDCSLRSYSRSPTTFGFKMWCGYNRAYLVAVGGHNRMQRSRSRGKNLITAFAILITNSTTSSMT